MRPTPLPSHWRERRSKDLAEAGLEPPAPPIEGLPLGQKNPNAPTD
jgi:hypothetical protein